MSTCSKCGTPRAHGTRCAPCRQEYKRQYRRQNRAHIMAYNRLPAVKARQRKHSARYRQEHPEKCQAYEVAHHEELRAVRLAWERRDRAAHPEKYREAERRYRQCAPLVIRAKTENRRAREQGAPGRYSAADIRRIYRQQRGKCAYCGIRLCGRYHLDHQTPLTRGGTNWPENIACACASCNTRKHTLTAAEYRQKLAKARAA